MSNATRTQTRVVYTWVLTLGSLAGCTEDLGTCDPQAAQELVYDRNGFVATKGQALMHDSCGQGALCHSSVAKEKNRHGVPADLNFDMLPQPTSVGHVAALRDLIWKTVQDGEMPPKGFAVGDSDWRFDVERRANSEKLPKLASSEGKAVMRNWLACGTPTVANTRVPSWTSPPVDSSDPAAVMWTSLHREIRTTCVNAGCHDGSPVPGAPGTQSVPFVAEECVVYRWLLFSRSQCGERLVVGGDADASALVHKLEDDRPACGERMPPASAPMPDKTASRMEVLTPAVRAWVEAGAFAPQCGTWSDMAPRAAGSNDGGAMTMAAPDWTQLHTSVITPHCATAGCHDAKAKAGDLELWDVCGAYRSLHASGSCGTRLVAGDPDGSSFYLRVSTPDKISNPACQSIMPPGAPLPTAQVNQIRAWIEGGASAAGCP